jgi:hypothetical protein
MSWCSRDWVYYDFGFVLSPTNIYTSFVIFNKQIMQKIIAFSVEYCNFLAIFYENWDVLKIHEILNLFGTKY